ncbi:hypothetical protein AGR1A_Lc50193 [Agrobacterium fabacearum CFBP 5771]|nr:hypothetical protein AGR1A_Lc50193 [Agrobacterium fabacearum CFBP 5771]
MAVLRVISITPRWRQLPGVDYFWGRSLVRPHQISVLCLILCGLVPGPDTEVTLSLTV